MDRFTAFQRGRALEEVRLLGLGKNSYSCLYLAEIEK
jgi:hypothetical protein